jgi:hypothetical protein
MKNTWNIKLDENGQPIMPKKVRCIENIIGNVDKDFAHMGKFKFLIIGKIYDVLPYPHKLSKAEVKDVIGKNGLLFMKTGSMNSYINKNYFEPIWDDSN